MADETLDVFTPGPPTPKPAGPIDFPACPQQLAALADPGLCVGTSSWKYPGWCGLVYDETRYHWRGQFRKSESADLQKH